MNRRGHSLKPSEAARILGTDKLYWSPSRLEIAKIVDGLFLRTLRLFDLSSMTYDELFLAKYARKKLFEKMQTLFQMGKHDELKQLIRFMKQMLPRLEYLIEQPDVFVTADGRLLNPHEQKRKFSKRIPKRVKEFMKQKFFEYVIR